MTKSFVNCDEILNEILMGSLEQTQAQDILNWNHIYSFSMCPNLFILIIRQIATWKQYQVRLMNANSAYQIDLFT
jgi:hypothetical protein